MWLLIKIFPSIQLLASTHVNDYNDLCSYVMLAICGNHSMYVYVVRKITVFN